MPTAHVRKLDANGDDLMGRGLGSFLFGSSATAQRLGCDLKVILGEWFWDTSDGVPWFQQAGSDVEPILGNMPANQAYAVAVLTARILACDGIASIKTFDFSSDRTTRAVSMRVTGTDNDGADFSITTSFP